MTKKISNLQAVGLAFLGFAFWVLADICMKLAAEAALPPYEIVGFLGLFGVLMVAGYGLPQGKIKDFWPKKPHQQLACAFLNLICLLCNSIALKYLPLTLFYVAVFTMPLIIVLLGLFLKEHLKLGQALAVIAGFAGMMVAINPFHDFSHGEWAGFIAAFLSAFFGAVMFVYMRRVTQSEKLLGILFFTSLIQAIGAGSMMLWHAVAVSQKTLAILVLMSLTAVLGNTLSFLSIKHTTASNFGQLHYTQIVTGAIAGYIIWGDIPSLNLYIGAAMIIISGIYIANHAHKMDKAA